MEQVVIIGAGPAGLTAAYELLKQAPGRYKVVILEESDAIGGISRTVRHNGNRMDIGGHRFFSKDPRVMDWWMAQMPLQGAPSMDDAILHRDRPLSPAGPDPEREDTVMLVRNRVSRIYYQNKFFDYPISMSLSTIRSMGFGTTLRAGMSYLASCLHKQEESSLENFYINRFGRVLYSMFFEGYTEKLWGRAPREISADWGAQRVKGLSIVAVLRDMMQKILPGKPKETETSLIEEFYYPKFGPGQLWETVAERVREMGGEIRMNTKVTALETEGGRVRRVVANGEVIEADAVFSSMPVRDLIAGMNAVPQEIAAIAAGLPYRDFVTVGVLVDRLLLKNETKLKTLGNLVPDCWIYVQDVGVKLGRIQIFNNWSPYLVQDPEHTVWIGLEYFCNEGDAFWNMDDTACAEFAIDELCRMGVIEGRGAVHDMHRERVKKAYPAYFDTYAQMDALIDYLNTFQNLYCIGRNGQHRYNNMDHSMATAFEAVAALIDGNPSKDAIWNVNTEQSYHEEKK